LLDARHLDSGEWGDALTTLACSQGASYCPKGQVGVETRGPDIVADLTQIEGKRSRNHPWLAALAHRACAKLAGNDEREGFGAKRR
jgi:hypothetical protein